MFELAMASFHAGLVPPIAFKQFDNFSNFHVLNSEILVMPPETKVRSPNGINGKIACSIIAAK
jgi:hypothetical protein